MPGRIRWDRERFVALYNSGAKLEELVACADRTVAKQRAWDYARRLGLQKRHKSTGDVPGRLAEALYVDQQKPLHEVARALGHSTNTVRRVLLMRGVQLRTKSGQPALEDDPTVAQVVRLKRATGLTNKQISKRFGKARDWAGRRLRFAHRASTPSK